MRSAANYSIATIATIEPKPRSITDLINLIFHIHSLREGEICLFQDINISYLSLYFSSIYNVQVNKKWRNIPKARENSSSSRHKAVNRYRHKDDFHVGTGKEVKA